MISAMCLIFLHSGTIDDEHCALDKVLGTAICKVVGVKPRQAVEKSGGFAL